ncbi:MAG: hypothetical protein K2I90_00500 [Odoribacter sp.]|nr:hypothetical protein [Odoribacter sp.]
MKSILYFISAAMILFLASCFDAKDSLATRDFEHVLSIKGLQPLEGTSHVLYMGDTLKLEPEISYTPDSRLENYVYRWIIGRDTVGREQNLNWLITRPKHYENQKTIPGVLIVRNTENGLEFRQIFSVEVYSNLTPTYIAVYETENGVDWASLQGNPEAFTRLTAGMNALVNGADDPISGKFRGAMIATSELLIFTDQAPGYGCSISLLKDNTKADFDLPIGKIVSPIRERIYFGSETTLNFRSVRHCDGGTRFLVMNDKLYAFNGMDKKLPIFDDQTYLKGENVAQILASKQFLRLKKANIIRYKDNTLSCFHAYNLPEEQLLAEDGTPFRLDSICNIFTEYTGLGINKRYSIYIIGKVNDSYNLYEFDINYDQANKAFKVPVWNKTIPLPQQVAEESIDWFGAFSQRYGFYVTRHDIYKFDYLNITAFNPDPVPFKSFPAEYEIVGIFPLVVGSGTKDADYCTIVYLYNKQKNTTTIHVYDTVTGKTLKEYPDAMPGIGKDFIKC